MTIDTLLWAKRLDEARTTRIAVPPLRQVGPVDATVAYDVQQRWVGLMVERGDHVVGAKVGLTSRVMQEQLGVSEPDFGTLLAAWQLPVERGLATADFEQFIAPRVEGEIAFLLREPLAGPGVSVVDVLRATKAVGAAIEIIDSRIEDWDIELVDTVADNASCGAFAVGGWRTDWHSIDLALAGMVLYVDGDVVATGAGAAALGHPAACVAWLANKLGTMGRGLQAGDVVLSGSLGPALPVHPGANVRLEIGGLQSVTVHFGRLTHK